MTGAGGFGDRDQIHVDDRMSPGRKDDIVILRRAFASEPALAPAPEACPAPETLWSALHGELSAAEVRQVVDHTTACSACAEDWRLAMELERGAEREREKVEPALSRLFRVVRLHPWIAAPVAAAAAFLISVMQWGGGIAPQGLAAVRGSEQPTIRPLVAENQALPRSRYLLGCTSEEKAVSYEFLVGTPGRPSLSSSGKLVECEYQVPESLLADVPARTRVSWQVEATFAEHRHVTSPTFHASVQ